MPPSAPRPWRLRAARLGALLFSGLLAGFAVGAAAQTIEFRQWHGTIAAARQPEQVVAGTMSEWRSLWSRVGVPAPDLFEPGRTSAVGIYLGTRIGAGYSVNVLSTSRRRDRIMVVFEERTPPEVMTAQRAPATRPISSGGGGGFPGGSGFGGPVASFAPPGPAASLAPPPGRPAGPPISPWAIVLINRADLPLTVEQRLFR